MVERVGLTFLKEVTEAEKGCSSVKVGGKSGYGMHGRLELGGVALGERSCDKEPQDSGVSLWALLGQ